MLLILFVIVTLQRESPWPQSGVGKTNLVKKVHGPEKKVCEKNFWVEKFLVKKKLRLKKFLVKQNLRHNFFWPKKIVGQKFLVK